MIEKSRWQQEYDALPEWAQKMVRAASGIAMYGGASSDDALAVMTKADREKYSIFQVALRREASLEWFDGFCDLRELAAALTAPYPPPTDLPKREKMTTQNVVEMMTAGDDDCAFDQPCYFGHRVESHAVYCHNEAWPDSPRKCRRNRDYYRHKDCPGFVANADVAGPSSQ